MRLASKTPVEHPSSHTSSSPVFFFSNIYTANLEENTPSFWLGGYPSWLAISRPFLLPPFFSLLLGSQLAVGED